MIETDFKYNLERFKRKLKDEEKDFSQVCHEILIEGVNSLVNNLAKYTPPNIGRNSLRKALYYRPIIALKELCSKSGYRGRHATADDYKAYREKMKFKVINTKAGRRPWKAKYAKTMGEAKKLAYIKARGISRVMWALHAPDVGAKISNSVQKLISNLQVSQPSLNNIFWVNPETVQVENHVRDIENIKDFSFTKSEEIARKRMEHLIKARIGGVIKDV